MRQSGTTLKKTPRYPNKRPTFSPLLLVLELAKLTLPNAERKHSIAKRFFEVGPGKNFKFFPPTDRSTTHIKSALDFAVHTTGKENPPPPSPPFSSFQDSEAGPGPDRARDFGGGGGRRTSHFHTQIRTQRKERKTKLLTVPNPTTGEIC